VMMDLMDDIGVSISDRHLDHSKAVQIADA